MKRKLKRTIAALSAIAMLGTTATVLPEGMSFDFGTGITASAAGTEQQSTDEATVYQPAVETTDKYDIDDDGTKDTVYEISNAGQLSWFAEQVNSGNTKINAVLVNNITVNENLLSSLEVDSDGNVSNGSNFTAWIPIGKSNSYNGKFDGQKYKISGLYFNYRDNNDNRNIVSVGLFGTINGGTVSNVCVADSYFKGSVFTGGVCGDNGGTVENCYNTGTISSGYVGGGVCGYSGGTVENCYNTGTVSGSDTAGGVCRLNNSTITNCYYLENTASGGIGNNDSTGSAEVKTAAQFASGEVTYLLNGSKSEGDTVHFYQNLSGENADALPVLDNTHSVVYFEESCKTGDISYINKDDFHDFDENGFCTQKEGETHYQPATLNETTGNYEISNAGQLYWFAGLVNGTLDGVEQNTLANAILTTNITVNENLLDSLQYDEEDNVSNGSDFITWTPIADWMGNRTTQYSGTFDGNNKTVSGLYFNGDSTCIGLFGSSESDGNIKNVGVVDSYFKGNNHVGGVCGNNAGTITNCYNAGNLTAIKSSADIGGICGYNNGGTVTNCYNTGTVTATGSAASVGGVCGCSIELISNCYNIGTVTATSSGADISDICGYYFGPITNCYYLADTEDENGGKTTAQFASGEVAYLLSQGCTVGEGEDAVTYSGSVWGQNLATENYPVLNGETVYQVDSYEGCIGNPGNSTKVYSNTNAPIYVEHNYSSKGACTICGAFKNGIGEHLDGYSLSLDGNIGVNFFMELDKSVIADENAYMKFRLPNGKTSVVLVGDAKQQTVGGTTYYVFSCEVAAKEMNETITAQIITSDKKGEVYEYSVADYIQYIRDNPTEFDEKTLRLVNAMAGYGDYAKAYFNNENLDANTEMDAVTADTLASFDKQISGDLPEGITYYGSSLLLESNTTMRHYFKVAEGTDVSALSFSGSKGNYYYIDIPNISAEKLGTIQNVTIGNCTISYSPMSYAYAVLSSKNTSESLKNLVKSLYLYEQAAEAYKN